MTTVDDITKEMNAARQELSDSIAISKQSIKSLKKAIKQEKRSIKMNKSNLRMIESLFFFKFPDCDIDIIFPLPKND